jgi:ribonucleoside-diphosphate reductase alpha chain
MQTPAVHARQRRRPPGPAVDRRRTPATTAPTLAHYQIIRRNGAVVAFEPSKIAVAMMKAFLAVHGTQGAASASVRETVDELTQAVVRALLRSRPGGGTFHIEDVQDQVELGLMRGGHHEVARAYVLYRERRAQERAQHGQRPSRPPSLHVLDGGERVPLDQPALQALIERPAPTWATDVQSAPILAETLRNLYDGVPVDEVYKAAILAARTLIEKDPDYTYATARLLLHTIAARRCWARGGHSLRWRWRGATPTTSRSSSEGRGQRAARRAPAAVRPGPPGRGAQARARPAVRLPGPADAVRPLLPAHAQDAASSCRRPSSCAWRWAWR